MNQSLRLSRSKVWKNAPDEIVSLSPEILELANKFKYERDNDIEDEKFHSQQNVQAVFGTFSGDEQPTKLAKDISAFLKLANISVSSPKNVVDVRNLVKTLHKLVPKSWLKSSKRVAHKRPDKYLRTLRVYKSKYGKKKRPWYEKKEDMGCDKKWKFTIERKCPSESDRKSADVPEYLRSRSNAEKFLWILARLEGRLLNMEAEGLRSMALPINKIRLLDLDDLEKEEDKLTKVFCEHLASSWSMPKLFTMEKQSVGGMDKMAKLLWEYVKKSETTNWFLIAHLMISREVYEKLTKEQLQNLRGKAEFYFYPFVEFLDREWKRGVAVQAKKHMVMQKSFSIESDPRVPRHLEVFKVYDNTKYQDKYEWNFDKNEYTKKQISMPVIGDRHVFVDVSGWNNVAGAYNNLLGILNHILPLQKEEPLKMIKCNLMLAADQMVMAKQAEASWLEQSNKEESSTDGSTNNKKENKIYNVGIHPSSYPFANLARHGFAPWDSVNYDKFKNVIVSSVKANKEKFIKKGWKIQDIISSFYALPNDLRNIETKDEVDSICGIIVSNSNSETFEETKKYAQDIGMFGAKSYGNA